MKWRHAPWLTLAGVLLACTDAPPRPAAPPPASSVAAEAEPPVPAAAPPPPPVARPSACRPPAVGTTSDDEAPMIRGATGSAELAEWLGARGVAREAARGWFAAHHGPGIYRERADLAFDTARCRPLRVGDRDEEALVCLQEIPTELVQRRALVVVVREKRPVAVLDVGLGLIALDFPDARWLDLALTIAPDGRSAELADRAPEGTMLVESQSSCIAAEKHAAGCEEKLARHPDPESFAKQSAGRETFRPLDSCLLGRGTDGRIVVVRAPRMPQGHPAKLHDCAGGRAGLLAMQHELAQAPAAQRAESRQSLAFFDKACAQRGRYVWKTDRFVTAGR